MIASGVRDPEQVAQLAVEHAARLLSADGAVVFSFDVTSGLLEPLRETESPVKEPPIAPGEGAVGIAFRTRQPVRVDDYQTWEHSIGVSASRGMRSAVAVPLLSDDHPIGAIGVWSLKVRSFTDAEVQLLTLIAAQVAPALQSARLTDEAERRAERFKGLHEVAVAAAGVLEPERLTKLVTERVRHLLGADGAGVWWSDPDGASLFEMARTDSRANEPTRYGVGEGAIGLAFQKRRAVMVADYQRRRLAGTPARAEGVASIAAVPLVVGDRPAGSLSVWTYQRRHFEPEDIQLLALFAAQVAPAIQAAHLSAEAEEKARTFAALYDLSVAAGGLLDPGGLASLAVVRAAELLEADAGGALFWWEPEAGLLRVLFDTSPDRYAPVQIGGDHGAAGQAFQSRQPVVIDDYQGWAHAYEPAKAQGIRSVSAVPLLVGDRALGALVLRSRRPAAFGPGRGGLMSLIAAQVAPALEAARLLDQRESQAAAFRILHQLAVTISGVLEPGELARQALEYARQLTGSEAASLALWDEAEQALMALGDTQRVWRRVNAPERGSGAMGVAFDERRPVVVDDYATWEQAHPAGIKDGVRSVVAVPLLVGDRPLGAISVRRYQASPYHQEDITLLSLLAAQVGPALQAARLVDERQAQARALAALQELAVAAGGLLQAEELAKLAVDRARTLFDHSDRVAIYWWDEESGHLQQLAHSGPRWSARLKPGQGLPGLAFASRGTVRIEDYETWEGATAAARKSGYKAGLAVPMMAQDRPVGAITMGTRDPAHRFTEDDASLLLLLASQVAPALEAARLHANLVRSEQHIRSLYETIACGVLVQLPDGTVLDANRAAEEMFGLSLRQMRGRRSVELWELESEAGAEARPAMIALRTRQPVRNFLTRVTRKDGQVRWLEADCIPVLGRGGEPVQVVSSVIDVTERRRAEAALRESEARFRAVFDHAAIGIARIDLDGHVIQTNPALCRMLGYEAWELGGTPLTAVIHPEDFDSATFDAIVRERQPPTRLEIRLLRKDGTLMWGSATASLVTSEGGEPLFMIGMVEDVSARRAQAAELEHQALHDALTGLPNRSLLHDRLNQSIRMAQREGQSMAFMMMDLDRFKDVNDTFGHHSGDLLLREVAQRLTAELRASDTVARLGGDEFAIVMMGVDSEAAAGASARKLLRALEPHFTIEGERFDVGGSVGIALFPGHGEDADTLMRRADVAMYVAKRAGSGYAIYDSEEDGHTPDRLALSGDLRQAIAAGDLVVHYQQQVRVPTLQVVGVEALVRWPHPKHGLLLPDAFIPLAEHTGLVRPLGIWVLGEAIRQCRRWLDAGLNLRVSVNLSVRNLHDPTLPETLAALLEQHRVEAGMLQVEITESTLMADPAHAEKVLAHLHSMGVGLAIDDFGTGYSSLAHLRRLPVNELKIDKSFVIDAPAEGSAAVIVRSIIDLGRNLGLDVVAEGVETVDAWKLVAESGCDLAQGDMLGLPGPPDELTRSLLGGRFKAGQVSVGG